MQISSLIPILMELVGRSNQGKEGRSPGRQAGTEPGPAGARMSSAVSVPVSKDTAATGETRGQQEPTAQNLPSILPLPLSSPLFEESRFYIKDEGQEKPPGKVDESTSIYACIRTKNLGLLWLALVCVKNSLAVTFFTGQDSCTEVIRESLPDLEQVLREMGFGIRHAGAVTRPDIRSCSDISGVPAGRHYILDMEV